MLNGLETNGTFKPLWLPLVRVNEATTDVTSWCRIGANNDISVKPYTQNVTLSNAREEQIKNNEIFLDAPGKSLPRKHPAASAVVRQLRAAEPE